MPQKARRASTPRRNKADPLAGHTMTPTGTPEVGKAKTGSKARSVRKTPGRAATAKDGKTLAARKPLTKRPAATGKSKLGAAAGGQTSSPGKFKRETFPDAPAARTGGRKPKASQKLSGPKRTASVNKAAKKRKTSAGVAKSPLRQKRQGQARP